MIQAYQKLVEVYGDNAPTDGQWTAFLSEWSLDMIKFYPITLQNTLPWSSKQAEVIGSGWEFLCAWFVCSTTTWRLPGCCG